MLKIAICDDMLSFADELEKNIQVWAIKEGINVKVRKFDDGVPLLFSISENGTYDLIFMDVEMERMNGLEAAAKIRENDFLTTLVFMSQYEDYYKEAYKVHPFHFISKPVSQIKLNRLMEAYMAMKKQDVETFTFVISKAQYTVHISDILYFNSEKRHIYVVCKDKTYSFYGKLNDVQKAVEGKNCRFLRTHQSFLVNMKYIKEYHYSDLVMSNGKALLISKDYRRRMSEVHKLMMEQS